MKSLASVTEICNSSPNKLNVYIHDGSYLLKMVELHRNFEDLPQQFKNDTPNRLTKGSDFKEMVSLEWVDLSFIGDPTKEYDPKLKPNVFLKKVFEIKEFTGPLGRFKLSGHF